MRNFSVFPRIVATAIACLISGSAAAKDDLIEHGAKIAKERCASCHGIDGRGISPDYPSLAGQHAEYIVKQIFHFKTGQRINPVMMPVVEALLAVDVRAVSQYFAMQRPGSIVETDETLLREGQALYFRGNVSSGISACAACHGVYATGGAQMPRMAGQNPVYLAAQLRAFIAKTRHNDRLMHGSLAAMSEREIRAVSAYLGHNE